jgi:hypothetical protein
MSKYKFPIVVNTIIPFKGYVAMNIFGIIFVRKEFVDDKNLNKLPEERFNRMLRHEEIHSKQILETGIIFFYIWYILEYIIRLLMYFNHSKAYRNIVFEQEAYYYESYPETPRKFWRFLQFYKK